MDEFTKKVCIIGDPSVGKTSLVRMFVIGKFNESYLSTLGTVITKKSVASGDKNTLIKMMLWDISGQAEFRRVHRSAFSDAAGCIIVCDVTRPETIAGAGGWLARFREHASDAPVVILVNKTDLRSMDKATEESLAAHGCAVMATSAKTGLNVEDGFTTLANHITSMGERLTIAEAKLAPELPETFATPAELMDYMAMYICSALNDQELGMHVLRKQVSVENIDFQRMSRQEADRLAERLGLVVKDMKGVPEAGKLKVSMSRAIERTRW